MNVLVLAAMTPFAAGDADAAERLVRALRAAGARAEAMRIPLPREPHERAMDAMLLARSLRIVNTDRLLVLGFPACLARHEAKTVLLDAPDATAAPVALRAALGDARAVFAANQPLADEFARTLGRPVECLTVPSAGEDALLSAAAARLLA
jgi:hypothetical protein